MNMTYDQAEKVVASFVDDVVEETLSINNGVLSDHAREHMVLWLAASMYEAHPIDLRHDLDEDKPYVEPDDPYKHFMDRLPQGVGVEGIFQYMVLAGDTEAEKGVFPYLRMAEVLHSSVMRQIELRLQSSSTDTPMISVSHHGLGLAIDLN